MSTVRLPQLLKALEANTLIIFDNDFVFPQPLKALGRILLLRDEELLMLESLRKIMLTEDNSLINDLLRLRSLVQSYSQRNPKHWEQTQGDINEGRRGPITAIFDELKLATEFKSALGRLEEADDELKTLLIAVGVRSEIEAFEQICRKCDRSVTSVLYFGSADGLDEIVYPAVDAIMARTSFRNAVFLIDRCLSTVANDSDGQDVQGRLQKRYTDSCIAQIITSNPDDTFDDDVLQLAKNDEKLVEKLCHNLALRCYRVLMTRFCSSFKHAAEELEAKTKHRIADVLAILNLTNTSEGGSAFESIYNWCMSANQYSITKALHNGGCAHDLSLLRFIQDDFLYNGLKVSNSALTQFEESINTFEVFDEHVNQKHLPISPGDVFSKNGEYFVLVAQGCDTVIRPADRERNLKTATLLKAEVGGNKIGREKASANAENGSVRLNHFEKNGNTLEVFLGAKKSIHCDFRLLDLCAINSNGESVLPECHEDLPLDIFPQYLVDYYIELHGVILEMKPFDEDAHEHKCKSPSKTLAAYVRSSDSLNYGYQRVCRIREPIYRFLHGEYMNSLSRIPLDAFSPVQEFSSVLKLDCKGLLSTPGEDMRVSAKHQPSKNMWIIDPEEVNRALGEKLPFPDQARVRFKSGREFENLKCEIKEGLLTLTLWPKFNGVVQKKMNIQINELVQDVGLQSVRFEDESGAPFICPKNIVKVPRHLSSPLTLKYGTPEKTVILSLNGSDIKVEER
jgi:hypothetical protein